MVKKKISSDQNEQAAAPVQKQQQKASNKSREEGKTEEHPAQAYQPPGNFKLLNEMQPFFTEASMPNKELWLLRIPLYELDMKDLSNKQWKLRLNASDGNIGHFEDSDGNRYNVVRHDIKGSRKYAYIPTAGDTIAVRQVPVEVSIVRSMERTKAPADGGAGDEINNAEEALTPELRAPSMSQEQEKSGVTKESSKRSSKEHHRGRGKKHKRESSREDGGGVSEGETVEQKQHKKKSKSEE